MSYNDETLSHYGIAKTAGGTGYPISNKDWAVDGKRIKKVCMSSGKFDKAYLDSMDWGKIKYSRPDRQNGSPGTIVYWYVYPKGEFKGYAIHGYVATEWFVGHNAVEIHGQVVVKH